jgi:uncharacterized alpha-E superfamily protein
MNAMLSRVADSLYWMSRYLERADHVARQFDVHLTIVTEQAVDVARRRRRRLITCLVGEDEHAAAEASDYDLAYLLTFDEDNPSSLVNCIASARENARQVREQINSQMWEQINQMYLTMRSQSMADLWNGQPHNFYHWINQEIYRFQGITDSRIMRDQGWHFVQIGRYLERASETADSLNVDFPRTLFERAGDRRRRSADVPGVGWAAARLRRLRGIQQGLHRQCAAAPHRRVSAAQPDLSLFGALWHQPHPELAAVCGRGDRDAQIRARLSAERTAARHAGLCPGRRNHRRRAGELPAQHPESVRPDSPTDLRDLHRLFCGR